MTKKEQEQQSQVKELKDDIEMKMKIEYKRSKTEKLRAHIAAPISDVRFEDFIHEIRGQKVMLDVDLARIYCVSTKAMNQAVRRNAKRFPPDFVFQLSRRENVSLKSDNAVLNNRSQIVTGSQKHRDPRFPPFAFTEHGAVMAANILHSSRAIGMSVFVVRAFVRMRAVFMDSSKLANKLAALEKELKKRLNVHESVIVDILQRMMNIIDPSFLPEPKRRQIGFRHYGKKGRE